MQWRTLWVWCGVALAGGSAAAISRWLSPERPLTPLMAAVAPTAVAGAPDDGKSPWQSNPRAAVADARAQARDVLVLMVNPTAREKVVDPRSSIEGSSSFRTAAGRQFTLLELGHTPQSATEATLWAERFGVESFPTIVLLDPRGRPYAKTACDLNDPSAALTRVTALQAVRVQRDAAVAEAEKLSGVERAKRLGVALEAVGSFAATEYVDWIQEVVALDPDNTAGLRVKYEKRLVASEVDAAIQTEVYPLIDRKEFAAAITRLDELALKAKRFPEQLQLLVAFKGQVQYSMGNRSIALATLNEAVRVNPDSESAAKIRSSIAQLTAVAP